MDGHLFEGRPLAVRLPGEPLALPPQQAQQGPLEFKAYVNGLPPSMDEASAAAFFRSDLGRRGLSVVLLPLKAAEWACCAQAWVKPTCAGRDACIAGASTLQCWGCGCCRLLAIRRLLQCSEAMWFSKRRGSGMPPCVRQVGSILLRVAVPCPQPFYYRVPVRPCLLCLA